MVTEFVTEVAAPIETSAVSAEVTDAEGIDPEDSDAGGIGIGGTGAMGAWIVSLKVDVVSAGRPGADGADWAGPEGLAVSKTEIEEVRINAVDVIAADTLGPDVVRSGTGRVVVVLDGVDEGGIGTGAVGDGGEKGVAGVN